jgi:hypothetical protein
MHAVKGLALLLAPCLFWELMILRNSQFGPLQFVSPDLFHMGMILKAMVNHCPGLLVERLARLT